MENSCKCYWDIKERTGHDAACIQIQIKAIVRELPGVLQEVSWCDKEKDT